MMRCFIRENETMTLYRFYKNLNDDFRKEVRLIDAFILDQAYTIMQHYKLLTKSQLKKHQNTLLSAPPCRSNSSSG